MGIMTSRRRLATRGATPLAVLLLAGCMAGVPLVKPGADPDDGPGGRTSVRATGGQVLVPPSPTRSAGQPATAGSPDAGSASPDAGPASPGASTEAPPATGLASPAGGFAPAAASTVPTLAPLVLSSPAIAAGASPVANPFGLPRTVRLELPDGLDALLAARLVSNNGGSLISDHGGALITDNGAGILGKMKLRLAQAAPVPSPTPSRTPAQAAAKLVADTLVNLSEPQKLVDLMLQAATAAGLQPGQTATFPFGAPAKTHVMALVLVGDHALLTVDEGEAPDPAKRIAALAFTSATRGTVVFRDVADFPGAPEMIVAETFDLDAGTITAAAAGRVGLPGAQLVQSSRYELRRLDGAPEGRAFTFRTSTTQHSPLNLLTPHGWKIAADFAADGTGAYWAEVFNKLGGPFLFPVDGVSYGKTPPAPYAFYMRTDGLDLPEAEAPAGTKALLPNLDVAVPAYVGDLKDADPFADPVFTFPN